MPRAWGCAASLAALASASVARAQSSPPVSAPPAERPAPSTRASPPDASTLTQTAPAAVQPQATTTAPPAENAPLSDIIVTAQKRAEAIQNVPVAVSAFNEQSLRAQGLDGASNLVQSIPNLSYQRRAIRNNFQIRGVGTQLVATSGDDGVGVHENNVPLTANRLGDAEFFDVERVEVLRGPQGTLYGRNATGGVVNVITNKPTSEFNGSLTTEIGNYGSLRSFGHVNAPVTDDLWLRVAAFALRRDGYTTNLLTGGDLDGRRIFSGRVTLAYHPTSSLRAFLSYEGFSENDTRGARKQLCLKDPGPTSVLGVPTGAAQVGLTQGCLPRSVYADDVYGTTNQLSGFSGILGRQLGIQPRDSFEGKFVSRDLREVENVGRPIYRTHTDLFTYNAEWDITRALTLSSLTAYNENHDYIRGDSTGGFSSVTFPRSALLPTGIAASSQLTLGDRLQTEAGQFNDNSQFSEELRLQSQFDGRFNFNVGGIYLRYTAHAVTYVTSNILDTISRYLNRTAAVPIYIDPLRNPDFTGHNYYQSNSYYNLKSAAALGEAYYRATDTLRFTLGLRYTDDNKRLLGSGSTLLVPGRGLVFVPEQEASFREFTGRVNVDWSPDLPFTDKTLIYASASRGYKGGGFNSPGVVALGLPSFFRPEFVNAGEVGTKNTLFGGRAILNLTGFYYDYKDYQIARSVNRSSFIQNVDARIYGVELESTVEPFNGFRINGNVGYLKTRITEGRAVDSFYRTLGDPAYIYGNSTNGGCILSAAGVATALQVPGAAAVLANSACVGPTALTARFVAARIPAAQAAALSAGIHNFGPGVSFYSSGAAEGLLQDLKGNELPNAPRWTVSLGAQYAFDLGASGWNATIRGDYYQQSKSFARYNNTFFDGVRSWNNVNASLIFARAQDQLSVQLFVKNARDRDTIVGFTIADENLGAYRSPAILDPRLFGVAVTKGF